jgi:hypothetical protein
VGGITVVAIALLGSIAVGALALVTGTPNNPHGVGGDEGKA